MGYDSDNELLYEIVKKNPTCLTDRENLFPLELFVQRAITREEIAYITIHVCAAMERNRYQGAQFTILLVCNGCGNPTAAVKPAEKILSVLCSGCSAGACTCEL